MKKHNHHNCTHPKVFHNPIFFWLIFLTQFFLRRDFPTLDLIKPAGEVKSLNIEEYAPVSSHFDIPQLDFIKDKYVDMFYGKSTEKIFSEKNAAKKNTEMKFNTFLKDTTILLLKINLGTLRLSLFLILEKKIFPCWSLPKG